MNGHSIEHVDKAIDELYLKNIGRQNYYQFVRNPELLRNYIGVLLGKQEALLSMRGHISDSFYDSLKISFELRNSETDENILKGIIDTAEENLNGPLLTEIKNISKKKGETEIANYASRKLKKLSALYTKTAASL